MICSCVGTQLFLGWVLFVILKGENCMFYVCDALNNGRMLLKNSNIENFKSECLMILSHVLNKNSTFIFTYPKYELKDYEYNQFMTYINRRCNNEPLQYILGSQEFMGLNFKVNTSVLIPRQDTEILVETILNNLPSLKKISILDIGTGSGCIAISLAHFIKNSYIVALDISKTALEVAYYNACDNKVVDKIYFLESDLLSSFEDPNSKLVDIIKNKFDIIVSNPPYISLDEMKTLDKEVFHFEPHSALYGGIDGLDFYKKIITQSTNFLKPNGLLTFEVGYNQSMSVSSLMKDTYKDIKIIKDLNKIDRVIIGKKI